MKPTSGRWAYYMRHAPRYLLPAVTVLTLAFLALLVGLRIRRRQPAPLPTDRLIVNILNVGQGEASWIRTPSGHFIVIGGGPPGQSDVLLRSLKNARAKNIDLLIIPYPYAEAVGGIPDLLRRYSVVQVWEQGGSEINQWQGQVRSILKTNQTICKEVKVGQTILMDGVRIEALAPDNPPIKESPVAANNSIVVRISFGRTRFLFAGGLEERGENTLLARQRDISANWLRVARFANRNASSPEFLRQVSPEIAVISVGPNRSGYPHPETISRLEATGALVYRTDTQVGSLQFISNGQKISGPY